MFAICGISQADLIETIFSVPEGRQKHIFSCTPPTFSMSRMKRLLDQYHDEPHGIWSVCTSFTHEVAAAKAKAILLDLGQLVAAQLNCTSLLQNQAVAECGNAAGLLKQGNVSGNLFALCIFPYSIDKPQRFSLSFASSQPQEFHGILLLYLYSLC